MNYYPSQGSAYAQPVYSTSSYHGHHGHHRHHRSSDDYYDQQPVTYVPTHSSGRRHGRHYSVPAITVAPTAPVVVQPSHSGHSHHHRHHHRHSGNYYPRSFGERVRHFFGLAPTANYRYKSDRSSWGFMGYSRRPRYVDARSGAEVDRHGRPVYRV